VSKRECVCVCVRFQAALNDPRVIVDFRDVGPRGKCPLCAAPALVGWPDVFGWSPSPATDDGMPYTDVAGGESA